MFCRSFVKYIPSVLKNSSGSFICIFWGVFLSRLYIFGFARGVIFFFETFVVAPTANSYFLKKFSISRIDSSVNTKKLVSSAYWESFRFSFWLGMGYHTIFSFDLMFKFITSPLIIYKRRDKGRPHLTSLESEKGVDK